MTIHRIPRSLRGTHIGDLAQFARDLLIKDRIQQHMKAIARMAVALRKEKRESGFCSSVYITCMTFTGDGSVCDECQNRLDHPKFKFGQTKYGKIRAREKAQERSNKKAKRTTRKAA